MGNSADADSTHELTLQMEDPFSDWWELVGRKVAELRGVEFSDEIMRELRNEHKHFRVTLPDSEKGH